MHATCPLCGADIGGIPDDPARPVERECPGCRTRLLLRRTTEGPSQDDAATVFQPRVLVETVAEPDAGTLAAGPEAAPAPREVPASPRSSSPTPGAYCLVLGAPPGRERIDLERAKTVFGRGEADVDLGDPALADRHFQIEASGNEFYLRDLGSGRGTRLNGREIRYTELLPGDEIGAGATEIVFRTPDDGVSRRRR